jgi:hypothetical protein
MCYLRSGLGVSLWASILKQKSLVTLSYFHLPWPLFLVTALEEESWGNRMEEIGAGAFDSHQRRKEPCAMLSPALLSPAEHPGACVFPSDLSSAPTSPIPGSKSATVVIPSVPCIASGISGCCVVYPKLPLHLCVSASCDSFSINSGWSEGEDSKGWGLAFHFVETAKEKFFSSFGIPLWRGQVSHIRGCPQLGHITPSLSLHTDPLNPSRHRCPYRWETENSRGTCDRSSNSTQTYTDALGRQLPAGKISKGTTEGLCPSLAICHSDI